MPDIRLETNYLKKNIYLEVNIINLVEINFQNGYLYQLK